MPRITPDTTAPFDVNPISGHLSSFAIPVSPTGSWTAVCFVADTSGSTFLQHFDQTAIQGPPPRGISPPGTEWQYDDAHLPALLAAVNAAQGGVWTPSFAQDDSAAPPLHVASLTLYLFNANDTLPTTQYDYAISGDAWQGTLCVTWVWNQTLYAAVHLAPFAYLGRGALGWESTQVRPGSDALNSAEIAAGVGNQLVTGYPWLAFDAVGVCRLTCKSNGGSYDAHTVHSNLSGNPMVNRLGGLGPETNWALQTTGALFSFPASVGRARTGRAWASYVDSSGDEGDPTQSFGDLQLIEDLHSGLGGEVRFGVLGQTAGVAPLANGFGALTTAGLYDTLGNIYDTQVTWLTSGDGIHWFGTPALTALKGQVVGLCRTTAQALIGLLWDWNGSAGAKTFRGVRSYDDGHTWESDAAPLAALPALSAPPCLVALEHAVFALYVRPDGTPTFVATTDGGRTWT